MSKTHNPLIVTWLMLLGATIFSAWLGVTTRPGAAIPLLVLLVAILKCRLVIRNFMDVRFAPAWLQRTCDGWLLFNFGMIASFYWFVA